MKMWDFLFWSGALFWILLIMYFLLKFYLGKNWVVKTGAAVFLGNNLSYSIRKFFKEYPNEIKKETLAEVAISLIKRLTRLGLIGVVFAFIPIWLLLNQNRILEIQNDKIDLQNVKITEQTYLLEAERRSALMILFSDVINDINAEKKEDNGKLSDGLINRIISLSRSFKPYYYLDGKKLTEFKRSPERGQLLLTIVSSDLDTLSLKKIFTNSDFSFAELEGYNLRGKYLKGVNLKNAYLDGTYFDYAIMVEADLSGASCLEASFIETRLILSNLIDTDLTNAQMDGVNLSACNLKGAILDSANLEKSLLKSVLFEDVSLVKTNFKNSFFHNPWNPIFVCKEKERLRYYFHDVESELESNPSLRQSNRGYYSFRNDRENSSSNRRTVFRNCNLNGTDFHLAYLDQVVFENCQLDNISFCHANLFTAIFNNVKTNSEINFYYTLVGTDVFSWIINNDINFERILTIVDYDKYIENISRTIKQEPNYRTKKVLEYINDENNYINLSLDYCLQLPSIEWIFDGLGSCYDNADMARVRVLGIKEKRDSLYIEYKKCNFVELKDASWKFDRYTYLRYLVDNKNAPIYHIYRKVRDCESDLNLFKLNNMPNIYEDTVPRYYFKDSIDFSHL